MEVLTVLVAVVALIIAVGLLFSLPVMLLWNGCLVGAINGVNEITWLQAWGILVLCGLLFKTTLSKKD
jgi:Sec-independent protein secretion pathway component TatC